MSSLAPDGWPAAGPDGPGSGSGLHGAPDAGQLVEAVREFLEGDVMDATSGRVRFHARVAARVLAVVERELASPWRGEGHARRLAALGFGGDAELAAAIRAGHLDDPEAVGAAVWADVIDKLAVANPEHLLVEDRPPGPDGP